MDPRTSRAEDGSASAAVRRGPCLSELLFQRWRDRPAGGRLPVDLLEYRSLRVLPLGHGPGLSLQGLHRRGLGEIGDFLVDERRVSDGVKGLRSADVSSAAWSLFWNRSYNGRAFWSYDERAGSPRISSMVRMTLAWSYRWWPIYP